MSVERFDPVVLGDNQPTSDGRYVRYEDYEALRDGVEKEIERLRDEGRNEPVEVGGKIVEMLNPVGRYLNASADRLQLLLDDTKGEGG